MCTAMTMQTAQGEQFFGRTMDFSYPLDPRLYVMPRNYEWSNLSNTHKIRNRYGFMGIGQEIPSVILTDGVNEMGFGAAALYFPGYAHYDSEPEPGDLAPSMAALEVLKILLGLCASVEQATALLRAIKITGVSDPVTGSVAPLHWILADKSGNCMVAEKTEAGFDILDNPIGVLTNSPGFEWHMTNLRNYMNASPSQNSKTQWGDVTLTPFGQGGGASELPGDYTPPSRFVRTAWQKTHVLPPADTEEAVVSCFHIMDGVSIPKGCVMTEREVPDYTQYTAFMNLSQPEYFFKTYDNSRIISARLTPELAGGTGVTPLGSLQRPIEMERWGEA